MSARKPIGARRRFEIFKRDEFTCQYCGGHPPQVVLHIDHIVPVAEGGDNEDDNLVTSCNTCNFGKGARLLTDVPPSLADRAAEVAEREAQLRGYAEVMAARRARVEDECWQVAEIFTEQFEKDGSIRKDWFQSIKRFVEELGVHECIEAMDLAVARKPYSRNTAFRYFCGICWRKIKGPNTE